MARLDLHRHRLPLLPLDSRRRHHAVHSQTAGAWRIPRRSPQPRPAPRRHYLRPRFLPERLPHLPLGHHPHPRRPAADRHLLLLRFLDLSLDLVARPTRRHRRPQRPLLAPHGVSTRSPDAAPAHTRSTATSPASSTGIVPGRPHVLPHQSLRSRGHRLHICPPSPPSCFGILAGHLLRHVQDPKDRLFRFGAFGIFLFCLGSILDLWQPHQQAALDHQLHRVDGRPRHDLVCHLVCRRGHGRLAPLVQAVRDLRLQRDPDLRALGTDCPHHGPQRPHRSTLQLLCLHAGLAPINASLAYAVLNVLVCYLAAWALWRRNWFLKF